MWFRYITCWLYHIKSYLSQKKQRVEVNNTFRLWTDILYEVPQGSILGPLLFNIFFYDLLLAVPNIDLVSYADDNTPYYLGVSEDELMMK